MMRLIDADALKEVFERYYNAPHVRVAGSGISTGLEMGIKGCLSLLDNAHTIEAEPVVHGRWDSSGRYRFENDELAVVCSECNCAISEKEYQECNWFYCPVCGAKMDLEGE